MCVSCIGQGEWTGTLSPGWHPQPGEHPMPSPNQTFLESTYPVENLTTTGPSQRPPKGQAGPVRCH